MRDAVIPVIMMMILQYWVARHVPMDIHASILAVVYVKGELPFVKGELPFVKGELMLLKMNHHK